MDRQDEREVWFRCEVEVRNPVTNYRFLLDGPGGYRWLSGDGIRRWDPPDGADFRVVTAAPPPGWVADAVFYQIFPDRFAPSGAAHIRPRWALRPSWDDPLIGQGPHGPRQLFGGDLVGMRERLGHLEALGVDAIYVTPFFPARSAHRYDTSSFEEVDPTLGGNEALIDLARALHERGMRLIGDLTLNHCGSKHPWFLRARKDPASTEASFFHRRGDEFVYWAGVRSLPKFDHRSGELRRRLYDGPDSVVAKWLRPPFELDGWRIDAANQAGRFEEVDVARDVARLTARTMRAARPDAYLVAEHMHDASADLTGDGWHGTMGYAGFTWPVWAWLGDPEVASRSMFMGNPLMASVGGGDAARSMDAFRAAIPWRSFASNLNLLCSHDTPRWRTVAGDRARSMVGAGLLMTYPGVPCLYYGDEVGLEGAYGEDGRRPMPWDTSRWDTTLFEGYRELVALRRSHVALRRGGFRWVHAGEDALAFLRETAEERILVHASRAAHDPVVLEESGLPPTRRAEDLLGGPDLVPSQGRVSLPADGPSIHAWVL